jgi:hypothetical protein
MQVPSLDHRNASRLALVKGLAIEICALAAALFSACWEHIYVLHGYEDVFMFFVAWLAGCCK